MTILQLTDEYKETGYRAVCISVDTVSYLENNLGDFFLHMKDGQIHAISEDEYNMIWSILGEEDVENEFIRQSVTESKNAPIINKVDYDIDEVPYVEIDNNDIEKQEKYRNLLRK